MTASDNAVDVAGRHGVGFLSPARPGDGRNEIILNSRSYDLMGHNLLGGVSHRLVDGTAILQKALVSAPGVWPSRGGGR